MRGYATSLVDNARRRCGRDDYDGLGEVQRPGRRRPDHPTGHQARPNDHARYGHGARDESPDYRPGRHCAHLHIYVVGNDHAATR